ncbi:MAG TPA: hypothetical protein VLT13_09310 [Bacteroidota bacterium]|nr:hypothetical protein [Bacteroidota bacterium]
MKRCMVVLVLMLICIAPLEAGQQDKGIAVEFKNLTVTCFGDLKQAGGRSQALVEAALATGNKERFGLGGMGAGEKVFEILDKNGAVVKSLTSADLFGGKGGSAFTAGSAGAGARRVVRVSTVDLPNGKVQVILRAIAAGDGTGEDSGQHLILTLGLKANTAMTLALRMSMKTMGNVEAGEQGFVVTPKTGPAALNVAVSPAVAAVSAGKGKVVVTSPPVALDGVSELPAFWMVINGQTGVTPAAVKASALSTLKEKRSSMKDPHLVVISATDKETTQPGDTVAFTVTCTNIGASAATDVTVSNPVPDGMMYLEGTATSYGCVVSMDRSAAGVKKVSWTFTDPVEAGGERTVSFKARVR